VSALIVHQALICPFLVHHRVPYVNQVDFVALDLLSLLLIGLMEHTTGTISSKNGTTSCALCPKGWYQSARGQTYCDECPIGTAGLFSSHITSHHITSHHIPSHHITSHHITSHHITCHFYQYNEWVNRCSRRECRMCTMWYTIYI
jgi:hypothetical protein